MFVSCLYYLYLCRRDTNSILLLHLVFNQYYY